MVKDEASYLADKVIRRQAAMENIELPPKYWNLADWKKVYRFQMMKAFSLLKLYSFELLKHSLDSDKGKKVYSLYAPFLEDIIHKQQEIDKIKELTQTSKPELDVVVNEEKKIRQQFNNKKTGLEGLD